MELKDDEDQEHSLVLQPIKMAEPADFKLKISR